MGRSGLHKLTFLVRKNSRESERSNSAASQAGIPASGVLSSSSSAPPSPSTSHHSPSTPPLRLPLWPPQQARGNDGKTKELQEECNELRSLLEVVLSADAVQRDILARLLQLEAKRSGVNRHSNEELDKSLNDIKLLLDQSGQAAIIAELRRENRKLRKRLSKETAPAQNGDTKTESSDGDITWSELSETSDIAQNVEKNAKDKGKKKEDRSASDASSGKKRRISLSSGESLPRWQLGADKSDDDIKRSNGQKGGRRRSSKDTVDEPVQTEETPKKIKRSRTLSFLSRSKVVNTRESSNETAYDSAGSVPLTARPILTSDRTQDEKTSSKSEKRKIVGSQRNSLPAQLTVDQIDSASSSSLAVRTACSVREEDLEAKRVETPFMIALNQEVAQLRQQLEAEEKRCSGLCELLVKADEKLSEKNQIITDLGLENDRLTRRISMLEHQLGQLKAGLTEAYQALRRESGFALDASKLYIVSPVGEDLVPASAARPTEIAKAVPQRTEPLPHAAVDSARNIARMRSGSMQVQPRNQRPESRNRTPSLPDQTTTTTSPSDPSKGTSPAVSEGAAEGAPVNSPKQLTRKTSVRMVVSALECRLSDLYPGKSGSPRTGPLSARSSPKEAIPPAASPTRAQPIERRPSLGSVPLDIATSILSPRSRGKMPLSSSRSRSNSLANTPADSAANMTYSMTQKSDALSDHEDQITASDSFPDDENLDLDYIEEAEYDDNSLFTNPSDADLNLKDESLSATTNDTQMQKKRLQVIDELVATEQRYLNALETLIRVYVEPLNLRENAIVTWEEIDTIFSNIEDIVALSKAFLSKLEQRRQSWRSSQVASPAEQELIVGDILVETFPMMRIYYPYCYNRDKASNLRRQLLRTNPLWQSFVQACQKQPECNNLDLAAFLIMPVQRIPRYQLLLRELIKCTPQGHEDLENLHRSLAIIMAITKEIDMKGPASNVDRKKFTSTSQLSQLSTSGSNSSLLTSGQAPEGLISSPVPRHYHLIEVGKYEDFVDVSRTWIKSDTLRAVCGLKEQLIWLYLFDDILLVHTSPTFNVNMWVGSPTSSSRFRKTRSSVFGKSRHDLFGRIYLSELWIRSLNDGPGDHKFMWQICAPDITFLFSSRGQEEKDEWMLTIATTIDKLLRSPTHQEHRLLVMPEMMLHGVEQAGAAKRAVSFVGLGGGDHPDEDNCESPAFLPPNTLYLARNFIRGGLSWRPSQQFGKESNSLRRAFNVNSHSSSNTQNTTRDHTTSSGSEFSRITSSSDSVHTSGEFKLTRDSASTDSLQPTSPQQPSKAMTLGRKSSFGGSSSPIGPVLRLGKRIEVTKMANLSQRDLNSTASRYARTGDWPAVSATGSSNTNTEAQPNPSADPQAVNQIKTKVKRELLRRNMSSLGISGELSHDTIEQKRFMRAQTLEHTSSTNSPARIGKSVQKGFLYQCDLPGKGGNVKEHTWSRRWCNLAQDKFIIYAGQQNSEESMVIRLRQATVSLCENNRGMHSFQLSTAEHKVILATNLEAEAMTWFRHIQEQIQILAQSS